MLKGIFIRKKGYKRSKEICKKISNGKKGIRFTKEHSMNISKAKKGIITWNKDKIFKDLQQEKSKYWKGEEGGYSAKHKWLYKYYGKANRCENIYCESVNKKMFHWANISGEYKRNRKDFLMLCVPCHRTLDRSRR